MHISISPSTSRYSRYASVSNFRTTVGRRMWCVYLSFNSWSIPLIKFACKVHKATRSLWCVPSSGNAILQASFSLSARKAEYLGKLEHISRDEYRKGTLCRRKKACTFKERGPATFVERLKRPRYETTGKLAKHAHSSCRSRSTDKFG